MSEFGDVVLRGCEEDLLDVEVDVYLDVGYFEGGFCHFGCICRIDSYRVFFLENSDFESQLVIISVLYGDLKVCLLRLEWSSAGKNIKTFFVPRRLIDKRYLCYTNRASISGTQDLHF